MVIRFCRRTETAFDCHSFCCVLPFQFLPQCCGPSLRRCVGKQLPINCTVFFLQKRRSAAFSQAVQQNPEFLFLSKGLVDKTQAVFKRCKCILPALLRLKLHRNYLQKYAYVFHIYIPRYYLFSFSSRRSHYSKSIIKKLVPI